MTDIAKHTRAKKALPELLTVLRADPGVYGIVEINFYGGGDEGSIDNIEPAGDSRDAIETWADAFLEETGIDWYNNDGGGGSIKINVETGEVEYDIYYNETVSNTAAAGTFTP